METRQILTHRASRITHHVFCYSTHPASPDAALSYLLLEILMQPMLTIAVRAARRAGDIIVRSLNRVHQLQVHAKDRNDFVTEVDTKVEQDIIETIRHTYPDHAFLAEESGRTVSKTGKDEFVWIIDPLDGTTNFLHGFPQFCVSLAVERRGRMEHAVVYDPMRQELFTASRGDGAQLDGKRIRVTKQLELDGALIGTGLPFRSNRQWIDAYLEMLKLMMQSTAGIRRPGAAALDLAYVAAGRLDGFWELGLSPWDTAAGTLLITEAGGMVGTISGHEYKQEGHIVAGTPKIYAAMIEAFRPHVPEELRGFRKGDDRSVD